MANGVAHAQSSGFLIGRVFSRAFGTIAANPLAALGIAVLFGALPSVTFDYVSARLFETAAPSSPVALTAGLILLARGLAQMVAGTMFATISFGAFAALVVAQEEGRRPSFADAGQAGARALFPLIALGLIIGIGTMLGLVLLIVPGIFLTLMWTVAAQALVVERTGIFAALGRSRTLAQGAWGAIFGLDILVEVILIAFGFLMTRIIVAFGGHADMTAIANQPFPITTLSTQLAIATITTMFAAAIYASVYVELRNWKDGAPEEALAEIFA